jgi:hypothetical protein
MNLSLSDKRTISRIGPAVFALDRWLRRRQGSYEFSTRPGCLFRIEPCTADRRIVLSDGTCALPGDPVINLHLWNEHIPRMGRRGPTVGWARQISHALDSSLAELSFYLSRRPDLAGVRVLYGEMSLATRRQTGRFQRLMARYGFEEGVHPEPDRRGSLRRLGDTILVLLLVLATNPVSLRRALRRYRSCIYLSRSALDARYGR